MINKTAVEMAEALTKGETSSVELTQSHLDRIADVDGQVKAFLHVDADGALAQAKDVDAKLKAGEKLSPLAGIPLALKDILAQKGVPTTAGSKILEGWRPPYDSTVVAKLKAAEEGDGMKRPRKPAAGRGPVRKPAGAGGAGGPKKKF